jgi:hypothetical protein
MQQRRRRRSIFAQAASRLPLRAGQPCFDKRSSSMVRCFTILAAAALGCLWIVPTRAQNSGSAADAPADQAGTSSGTLQGDCNCTLRKGPLTYFLPGVSFKFTCTAPCTVEQQAMIEVGRNEVAGNAWAISGQIDGKPDHFTAPFQGTLPVDRSYVTGNFAWSVSVATGTHIVQPTVFITAGPVVVGFYHVAYQVSQP